MLSEYDKYYNIRISSILISDSASSVVPFYSDIASTSSGVSLTLSPNSGMSLLSSLVSSLVSVVRVDSDQPWSLPHLIHTRMVESSLDTRGDFLIDRTLGRDTTWGVFVEDDEDHHIKSVEFRDSTG